jgi:hypothetical protein
MNSTDKIIDAVDTAVIYILGAEESTTSRNERRRIGEYEVTEFGADKYLRASTPKSPWCFMSGIGDADERLVSTNPRLLREPFTELIGGFSEALLMSPGGARWIGCEHLRKRPKRILTIPGVREFYCITQIDMDVALRGKSYAACVGVTSNGQIVACPAEQEGFKNTYQVNRGKMPWRDTVDMAVAFASMIDDFTLADRWKVSFSADRAMSFSTTAEGAREAFAFRDAPLSPAGRRKAILHWVRAHGRKKQGGGIAEVPKHLRGITEFTAGGVDIRIESPTKERTAIAA